METVFHLPYWPSYLTALVLSVLWLLWGTGTLAVAAFIAFSLLVQGRGARVLDLSLIHI